MEVIATSSGEMKIDRFFLCGKGRLHAIQNICLNIYWQRICITVHFRGGICLMWSCTGQLQKKKKRKKEKERKKPLDFVTNYFVYLSWWIRPCYEYYSCLLMLSVPLWNMTIFIFIPNPFQATTSPVFALSIERH